jgi:hypothetical protein
MTMRQTTNNLKGVFGGHERLTAEDTAQRFELGGGPMCEVGQRARFDLAVLTVTFAQEDGWR